MLSLYMRDEPGAGLPCPVHHILVQLALFFCAMLAIGPR